MRRLAIFVEGFTELLFVERLLEEIAGANRVLIEATSIRGGVNVPKKVHTVRAAREQSDERFYVLIVDCGGDRLVAQRIREEHSALTTAGYELIIGLRDVRPDARYEEVPALERGLRKYIKTSLAPVVFVLATMEVEAWFLSEPHHFPRIDPAITSDAIVTTLGFDPRSDDLTRREHPQVDLNAAYGIGGRTYSKPAVQTIEALDFDYIYTELRARITQVDNLIGRLDDFFA